jgi:hypothetical protein
VSECDRKQAGDWRLSTEAQRVFEVSEKPDHADFS